MKRNKRPMWGLEEPGDVDEAVEETKRAGSGPHLSRRLTWVSVVCLLVLLATGLIANEWSGTRLRAFEGRNWDGSTGVDTNGMAAENAADSNLLFATSNKQWNSLLQGLLAAGVDEDSCLSRYQSFQHRKAASPHQPSTHLLEKLRQHEALQRKCAPHTELYNNTLQLLKSGETNEATECNYVVWIPFGSVGDRMLTLASTFLFALLTDKVLLIERGEDMVDLFCEPFPDMTWLLPLDFDIDQFGRFAQASPISYGNMLKHKIVDANMDLSSNVSLPAYVYVHLVHDYSRQDKLFFCGKHQNLLQRIPWMLLMSNNYFAPSLFLIPKFEDELSRLFPEKDSVFHHLGRYLFHPTNVVWSLITKYYQSYLAEADERVGIQIKVFEEGGNFHQYVFDQVLSCITEEGLLPGLYVNHQTNTNKTSGKSKSVVVSSLSPEYSNKIRDMYLGHQTLNGDVVTVFQPSYGEKEQFSNRKALTEMYLLSLSDVLVTSSWSTSGYVAQGLGGIRPWILAKPENQKAPEPACRRAMSMEPCFHAPPFYDCGTRKGVDTGALVPHVRHCEDVSWGLKLVDHKH